MAHGPDDVAARLGDDAHALRQLQRAPRGSARRSARCPAPAARSRSGSRRRCRACRSAPSFSRRAAAMQPARRPRSPRRACTASGACEPTWKDRPRTSMPSSAARRASSSSVLRIAAELARQVARPRRGCGTTRAAAAPPGRRRRANLRTSSGLSATKVRTPNCSALRMSASRLIGCVWMQRSGATPRRATSCTSPVVARSRKPPSPMMVCTTAAMRQRLQRVVQVDAAAAPCAACGTARARARSRRSAAASRTRAPAGGSPRAGTDR